MQRGKGETVRCEPIVQFDEVLAINTTTGPASQTYYPGSKKRSMKMMKGDA
jgi:hypothetical protein